MPTENKKTWKDILTKEQTEFILLLANELKSFKNQYHDYIEPLQSDSENFQDWHKYYKNPNLLNEPLNNLIKIEIKKIFNRQKIIHKESYFFISTKHNFSKNVKLLKRKIQNTLKNYVSKHKPEFSPYCRFVFYQILCFLNYGIPIDTLYKQVEAGDVPALAKFISIDSSIISSEPAKKILQKIEIEDDVIYKTFLGNALKKKNKLYKKERYIIAKIVSVLLFAIGKSFNQHKLSVRQISEFLQDNNITDEYLDYTDLRKKIMAFLNRWKKVRTTLT